MAASINPGAVINNIEFAQKAHTAHDIIPVSQFTRLADMLADTSGQLDCQLQGGKDGENVAFIRLQVQGLLNLTCQRCLQPYQHEIVINQMFKLVRDEAELPAPEDERDDEDFLLAQSEMPVLDLIENEVILALPIAPKHADGECSSGVGMDEYRKPNPFAMLEMLKSKK
ncbi:MAG TPA: YceD family protein [Methylophilaceae bacterium]|jgi:uncharacterized protein